MTDDILDETLRCLRYHCHPEWGDRTSLDVFNRLLAKNIRAPGWQPTDHMNIAPEHITSSREVRSTEELARLRRGHPRARPVYLEGPIIVAVYKGEERLLDGNTRINLWVQQGNPEGHLVHVHLIEMQA